MLPVSLKVLASGPIDTRFVAAGATNPQTSNAYTGLVRWRSDTANLEVYDGSVYRPVATVASNTPSQHVLKWDGTALRDREFSAGKLNGNRTYSLSGGGAYDLPLTFIVAITIGLQVRTKLYMVECT